jgi:hypothetical protein
MDLKYVSEKALFLKVQGYAYQFISSMLHLLILPKSKMKIKPK